MQWQEVIWTTFEEKSPEKFQEILVSDGLDVYCVCYGDNERTYGKRGIGYKFVKSLSLPSGVDGEGFGTAWLSKDITIEKYKWWTPLPNPPKIN